MDDGVNKGAMNKAVRMTEEAEHRLHTSPEFYRRTGHRPDVWYATDQPASRWAKDAQRHRRKIRDALKILEDAVHDEEGVIARAVEVLR